MQISKVCKSLNTNIFLLILTCSYPYNLISRSNRIIDEIIHYLNCNFHPKAMDILDGDEVRLSSRGRYAERDIVQVW